MAAFNVHHATCLFAVVLLAVIPAGIAAQDAEHAPDFRTLDRIAPLTFPPKPNAPFMTTAKTLWVRTLPDGSTVTKQNERIVARDMDGRVFQERATFIPVPSDGNQKSQVYATVLSDPINHTIYNCRTQQKVCDLCSYYEPVTFTEVPAGLQPDKITYLTRESLEPVINFMRGA